MAVDFSPASRLAVGSWCVFWTAIVQNETYQQDGNGLGGGVDFSCIYFLGDGTRIPSSVCIKTRG